MLKTAGEAGIVYLEDSTPRSVVISFPPQPSSSSLSQNIVDPISWSPDFDPEDPRMIPDESTQQVDEIYSFGSYYEDGAMAPVRSPDPNDDTGSDRLETSSQPLPQSRGYSFSDNNQSESPSSSSSTLIAKHLFRSTSVVIVLIHFDFFNFF